MAPIHMTRLLTFSMLLAAACGRVDRANKEQRVFFASYYRLTSGRRVFAQPCVSSRQFLGREAAASRASSVGCGFARRARGTDARQSLRRFDYQPSYQPTRQPSAPRPTKHPSAACPYIAPIKESECPSFLDIVNCKDPSLGPGDLCEGDGECGLLAARPIDRRLVARRHRGRAFCRRLVTTRSRVPSSRRRRGRDRTAARFVGGS